jgi:hypothetical protein
MVCAKRNLVNLRQGKTAAKIGVRDVREIVKEVVKSVVAAPSSILVRAGSRLGEHVVVVVWHFESYGRGISGAMISVIDDMD